MNSAFYDSGISMRAIVQAIIQMMAKEVPFVGGR